MSDQDVLKEFLVRVGYAVDESSERKVSAGVDRLTKGVMALGAAATAMAVAVGAGVQRVAVSFDSLYFASGRIGALAGDIRAYNYALSQLGGTAEGAMQSLENVSRRMRSNPGFAKQLEVFAGGKFEQGKLSEENLINISRKFKALIAEKDGYYKALRYGEHFGFDEASIRAMARADFEAKLKQSHAKDKAAGLDPEKAARDAQRFMQAWRDVFRTLETIVDSALTKIMGGEGGKGGLVGFAAWFEKQTPAISKAVADIAVAVGHLASSFTKEFAQDGSASDAIKQFGEGARNVASIFKEIAGYLKTIHEYLKSFEKFMDWAALDTSLFEKKYSTSKSKMFGAWADQGRAEGSTYAAGHGALQSGGETSGGGGSGIGRWWRRNAPGWLGGSRSPDGSGARAAVHRRVARGALAANQKEAYDAARAGGLSDVAAKALVANMSGEALHRPDDYHWDAKHMASGIVQWDPQRSAAIKAKFGKMPHEMSVAEQTRAALWEMKEKYPRTWAALNSDRSAESMIGTLVSDYERPANVGLSTTQRIGFLRGLSVGDGAKVGPTPTVAASAGGLPRRSAEAVEAANRANAEASRGLRANPFGSINPNAFKTAPLGSGQINSWHAPTTHNATSNVSVKVDGAQDPDAVARHVARRVEDANNRALRNGQGAVN